MTLSCNSLASRRYRALVLLGTFGGLRWGELAALRRGDIDLKACTVSVDRQHMLADTVGKVARAQMRQVRKSATGKGVSGTKVARPPARAS